MDFPVAMAVPRQRDWNSLVVLSCTFISDVAMAVPRQRDWNRLEVTMIGKTVKLVAMAVPRQRDWNKQRSHASLESSYVAMAVPRQRDWNFIIGKLVDDTCTSCNGCPSTEGLKHKIILTRVGSYDCCNGCPSTEGLKLFFAIWNFCVILVVMDVFRQRDWNLTY